VVIRERRPVRRAGMVGTAGHPAGPSGWNGARPASQRLGWIEELERLRNALTEDEFESAKRHLLAG
jgi:hypothetical protein